MSVTCTCRQRLSPGKFLRSSLANSVPCTCHYCDTTGQKNRMCNHLLVDFRKGEVVCLYPNVAIQEVQSPIAIFLRWLALPCYLSLWLLFSCIKSGCHRHSLLGYEVFTYAFGIGLQLPLILNGGHIWITSTMLIFDLTDSPINPINLLTMPTHLWVSS